jgi:hypothetical protein
VENQQLTSWIAGSSDHFGFCYIAISEDKLNQQILFSGFHRAQDDEKAACGWFEAAR